MTATPSTAAGASTLAPAKDGHDPLTHVPGEPYLRPGHTCTCGSRRQVRVIPHVGPMCRRCRNRLADLIRIRRAAR